MDKINGEFFTSEAEEDVDFNTSEEDDEFILEEVGGIFIYIYQDLVLRKREDEMLEELERMKQDRAQ